MKKSCPECGADMAIDFGCDGLPDRYICTEPDCDGEIISKKRLEDVRGSGIELLDDTDEDEEDYEDVEMLMDWDIE